jgi:2,3-dimethylmalate lyase
MADTLKRALAENQIVVAPGVYDMISAKIADTMGFPALYMTGYGTVASHLGLPDVGLASYTDMLSRVATIASGTSTPLIADGDTGYGGTLNVRQTVRGYEKAGAAAIQIEDQVFPKKCGHTPGRRVVGLAEMLDKIKVAVDSRASEDFLIIARTDARTSLGLDAAIERGLAFADAGADVVFIESPETEEEMAMIGASIDVPLLANMVENGRTPLLPSEKLAALGFSICIYPVSGLLAGAAALDLVYSHLRDRGSTQDIGLPLYSFKDFNRLIGFEEVWEFEKKYAAPGAD